VRVGDEHAAGGEGGPDPALRLVVRDGDVEMDAVAPRALPQRPDPGMRAQRPSAKNNTNVNRRTRSQSMESNRPRRARSPSVLRRREAA